MEKILNKINDLDYLVTKLMNERNDLINYISVIFRMLETGEIIRNEKKDQNEISFKLAKILNGLEKIANNKK